MENRRQFSFRTTGEFAGLGGGYAKHCGPTAITNLILTLRPALCLDAAEVFSTVAALGSGHGLYWNLSRTKWVGGTTDVLAGAYIRMALRAFDLSGHAVRFAGPVRPSAMIEKLRQGHIVYLEMHFHPRYRNHQLLVYDHGWNGFLAADGWAAHPVFLGERDLARSLFMTIS